MSLSALPSAELKQTEPRAGRHEVGRRLQRDRRRRQREQRVQFRRHRLGPAEQRVQEAHGYLLSCWEIRSSWASRFSSVGWVENRVDSVISPARLCSAGAK